ncbi:hypothetical protein [Metallosphaera turreted icosahedral virus 3]|nr:hypothetical protein [Metallosphaera turreted icosahedral virus 3]
MLRTARIYLRIANTSVLLLPRHLWNSVEFSITPIHCSILLRSSMVHLRVVILKPKLVSLGISKQSDRSILVGPPSLVVLRKGGLTPRIPQLGYPRVYGRTFCVGRPRS